MVGRRHTGPSARSSGGTGTSVGTRAQMAALMRIQAEAPLAASVTEITLADASPALANLAAGTAPGRYCMRF